MLLKSADEETEPGEIAGVGQPKTEVNQRNDADNAAIDTRATEPNEHCHLQSQCVEGQQEDAIAGAEAETTNLSLFNTPALEGSNETANNTHLDLPASELLNEATNTAHLDPPPSEPPNETAETGQSDQQGLELVNSTDTSIDTNTTNASIGTNVTNATSINDQLYSWAGNQNAEEQELVPDEIESDSALGSDTESETTSLAESIWHFRMEHGRSYHAYKEGKYIFPNDERESDRLDMQHHLLKITYKNKLFFAPLTNPKRCVDIGTGTGIWAIDFADEFPQCEVLGIDLSPCQPTLVPPNLKFIVDDAEDLWLYEEKFDFIHLRLMAGCFSDWQKFFRQAYENLEPGGWLELQDYGLPVRSSDGTHYGTDVFRWGELLCEAGRKIGRPLGTDCSDNYPRWMEEAGFVDISQEMFMWPTNTWPKDPFMKYLGRWNMINILDGLEGFCLALLTRGLGWKKQEVDIFVARISADLKDRSIHAYFPMPVTWARKPYPGEVAFL